VCGAQLEKFLLFERNLLLLSRFASHLPHNLCPAGESVTMTSLNVTDNNNNNYLLMNSNNRTDNGHSAQDDRVCFTEFFGAAKSN